MRKLEFPYDDNGEIQDKDLLNNLCSAKQKGVRINYITTYLNSIKERYDVYEQYAGNPWTIKPIPFGNVNKSKKFKDYMNSLYDSPTQHISFIKELRNNIRGACPMCGRDGNGTLDHYLPKAIYPEYSFLSKNLIPACDRCNRERSVLFKGTVINERPIHPYFDDFAQRRIMTIQFEPDWRAPLIKPIPFEVNGDEKIIVQWHIDNIVVPSGIYEYLSHLWGCICRAPEIHLGNNIDIINIKEKLHQNEQMEESIGETPNAWKASFYHGLQKNEEALGHLSDILDISLNRY